MFEKEFAKQIIEKINNEKISLISDQSDFITQTNRLKYYYSSKLERSKHIEKMSNLGYEVNKDTSVKEHLYANFAESTDEWIYVWFAEFIKYNAYKPYIK